MNGFERFLSIMDKYGVSLVIIGVILFLAIKYTPKIIEAYKCYVQTMQKFTDSMESLSNDIASLDVSVDELRQTMDKVGTAVNHNSDRLLEIVKEVSFIKGRLNGKNDK